MIVIDYRILSECAARHKVLLHRRPCRPPAPGLRGHRPRLPCEGGGAAQVHLQSETVEHGGLGLQCAVGGLRVGGVDDLNVVGLVAGMNWSRLTPWSTACMTGHSGLVASLRRVLSAGGSSTEAPRPRSRCSAPPAMYTRDHT